jgi:Bacterial Ig-like domain
MSLSRFVRSRFVRSSLAGVAAAALVSFGALVVGGGVGNAAVPTAPSNMLPNDTTSMHKDVVLTWAPVAGATSYEVQLTTDSNFTNPMPLVAAPTPRYVPSVALPHADYLWRVRAVNGDGHGSWSSTAEFVRGWNVRPVGLTHTADGVFSWTPPIGDAASYDVQFSPSPDFGAAEQSKLGYLCRTNHSWWTNLKVEDIAEPDTECRPLKTDVAAASGIPAGNYYWRVRGLDDTSAAALGSDADPVNNAGCQGVSYETLATKPRWNPSDAIPECSHWSASYGSQVNIPAVGTADNPDPSASPSNIRTLCPAAACTNDTPVITWTSMDAPSYEVYIGTDPSFSSYSYVYATQTPAVAPRISLHDRHRYYVLVHACYDDGCGAASMASFTKTSDAVVTGATSPLTQAHPVLSWTDYLRTTTTLEAKEYHIQIGKSANMDDDAPVLDVKVDRAGEPYGTSTYQPTGLADGTHYWRVQAIDASDRGLTWSGVRSFVTDTTGPTATITTANGMPITGTVSVRFSEPVTGIAPATLRLMAVTSTVATAGAVTATSPASTAIITPTSPLVSGQTYRLYVSPAVTDQAGNAAVASVTTVRTATTVTAGSSALKEIWDPVPRAQANGGSYAQSATRNATETLTLRGQPAGTSVKLYAVLSPAGGWAHMYIDGVLGTPVSFYGPVVTWKKLVWTGTLPTLASGSTHTVQIVAQGDHHPVASRGNYVFVDQWTVGTTNYQEASEDTADAQHAVVDTWSRHLATDAANLTTVVDMETASSTAVGAELPTASARIAGKAVTVRLCKSPAAGYADISVDGARKVTVSLYQSYTSCGIAAYTGALVAGEHTVAVGVTGRVPAHSKGAAVAVDTISVT